MSLTSQGYKELRNAIVLAEETIRRGRSVMRRNRDIQMLHDTLQILNRGYYEKDGKRKELKLSKAEMAECVVLLPEDVEKYSNDPTISHPPIPFHIGRIRHECENIDSFTLARKQYESEFLFRGDGKKEVLVLNFANPVNPGGGVRNGAKAQEEDLCRKSSLLLSLESEKAEAYYNYNLKQHTKLGSDAMIFTPKVEIIKDRKSTRLNSSH